VHNGGSPERPRRGSSTEEENVEGYIRSTIAQAAGEPGRAFDWCKAARILKERQPAEADAGLLEDWGYTAGTIWLAGEPVTKSYTYLASLWATPALRIGDEYITCAISRADTEWDSHTVWPPEALAILAE
jgi:hypothetical protein